MKFIELEKELKNGVLPIYQIFGKDAFLRESALNDIKKVALSEPDLNLTNFQGVEVLKECDDFISAVRSYPFLSEKRYIVVYDFYPMAKDLKSKKFSEFFDAPSETSVVIFVNEKKCEALSKHPSVSIVDCDKVDDRFIVKWITGECLKSKVIIGQEALNKIIEYTSSEMTKISTEVYKLISYVGENNEITVSDVSAVISKDVEYEVYEFTGYIADLKYDKAFATLKELLNKNQDKQKLFISIYYHFRRLLHASISNLSESQLARALGVKEYAVKMARIQAKKFTPIRLKNICDKLGGFDGAFKSGDISVDSALWNSVFNVLIS